MRVQTLRMKPDLLPEEVEQADLIARIDRHAERYPELLWLYHVPNGGWRGVIAGKRMKAQGVRPGVPDLALDLARGGYHGLRIEMKRIRESTTSPDQKKWHEHLRECGYRVEVCKGADAAWSVLLDYLAS